MGLKSLMRGMRSDTSVVNDQGQREGGGGDGGRERWNGSWLVGAGRCVGGREGVGSGGGGRGESTGGGDL